LAQRIRNLIFGGVRAEAIGNLKINKGERYSRVPRLSDTRYSAIWRYASSKARLKCATYRRYTDLSVMGVRVGVANLFLDQSIGIDETNTFQLKFFI